MACPGGNMHSENKIAPRIDPWMMQAVEDLKPWTETKIGQRGTTLAKLK